jgi:ubiquinone/menaquinone biosynthesis C-methylase UbiE
MVSDREKQEKPKYGWYVGKVLLFIGLIGVAGLVSFILGFFVGAPLNYGLWIVGIGFIIIFLWPTIGFIAMNLWIPRQAVEFAFLKQFQAPKILDCGCGTGLHAIKMAKQLPKGGSIIGIDIYDAVAISGNSLQRARTNAGLEGVADKTDFQYGSITEIPFDNQSFNIVSVGSVLHEIHDDKEKEKVYIELFRVLKDEGLLFFGEWNRNSWQLILFAGIFALVFKPKDYWERSLQDHGFRVIKTENFSGFIDFYAKKQI